MKDNIQQFLDDDTDSFMKVYLEYISSQYSKPLDATDSGIKPNLDVAGRSEFENAVKQDYSQKIQYGAIATGVVVGLAASPVLGVAVAFAGSKFLGDNAKKRFVEDSLNALQEAANTMCSEFYQNIQNFVKDSMAVLETKTFEVVRDAYDLALRILSESIQAEQESKQNHDQQLQEIYQLRTQIETYLNDVTS